MTIDPRRALALLAAIWLAASPAPALASGFGAAPTVAASSTPPALAIVPGPEAAAPAPWWPALVTLGTPLVLFFTGPLALPIGWASGHIAAGDPWRGLGAAALGYPVMAASAIGASAAYAALRPGPDLSLSGLSAGVAAGVLSGVIYTGLVAWDANQTAARVARERAAGGSLKP